MKPTCCLLLLLAALSMPSYGQDTLSAYLFDDYHDAVVYFRDGRKSAEKVNYNLVEGALYFIDKRDGQVKVVSNYQAIDSLIITGRTFLLDGSNALEKVSAAPVIYIRFNANSAYKPQTIGYGVSSELASVDAYSSASFQGIRTDLKGKERQVSKIYYDYFIVKNGNRRRFSNFKQLYRIYPGHQETIEKYVAGHKLDFNDVRGIVALCRYSESL
ncbi:hypothetical protein [Parapedobacter sp. 2B3]|uniref:hypothetical protein n=1 Tax=Parapedobacter sp. 2B3 TaxID=3342381 RepID=UPI0035B6039C